MRYVILRDDDTNAFTPFECLEKLYRPFLERELPVNLAVIPCVRSDATMPDGRPEGFLLGVNGAAPPVTPLACNPALVKYLHENPGFHLVQHGCHHDPCEFDQVDRADILRRIKQGARTFADTGFAAPQAFVAPHDRFSAVSLQTTAGHFRIISSGWFEWRRVPPAWWPQYVLKKMWKRQHWHVNGTLLLSHPGCLLSYHRPYPGILEEIKRSIACRKLTVLVTHWWEYFRERKPDEAFIRVLHDTAAYLADDPDIRVVTFDDLAQFPRDSLGIVH